MNQVLSTAFRCGYERMAAWSNLLDDINVYPVADADTGRNLRISLTALKDVQNNNIIEHLLMSATGNSGNIAGAFFSKFVQIETCDGILNAAIAGKSAGWNALLDPKPGTMLAVFDALASSLQLIEIEQILICPDPLLVRIKDSVLSTSELLNELRQADVVDSGALGMFLFFEGFFKSLSNQSDSLNNPYDLFGDKLRISNPIEARHSMGYCIDTVIIPSTDLHEAIDQLSGMGDNVVAVSDGKHLKIHCHAQDETSVQTKMASVGDVIRWRSERIECRQWGRESQGAADPECIHIVTDAAGSMTADVARGLGITLLDSYILMDDQHLPESVILPGMLYGAMSRGIKVTTAQASIFERHQSYEYLTQRFSNILYLCVGAAYSGYFNIASRWAAAQNGNNRCMTVVDTGAASGRLGLIARSVARYAIRNKALNEVVQYAHTVSQKCDELVFLEQLKFLAAGGRISKANGFIGDFLKIKPIIRPGAQGVQKIGTVKNHNAQVDFLIHHLRGCLNTETPAEILLQYTDNLERVINQIQPRIQGLLPFCRISVQPMSLTSGVHMGPGTWAVAFLPGLEQ